MNCRFIVSNINMLLFLQCSDTVSRATGRASGL